MRVSLVCLSIRVYENNTVFILFDYVYKRNVRGFFAGFIISR